MPPLLVLILQCLLALFVLHGGGYVVLRVWLLPRLRAHYLAPFASVTMLCAFGFLQGTAPLTWNLLTLALTWVVFVASCGLLSYLIHRGIRMVATRRSPGSNPRPTVPVVRPAFTYTTLGAFFIAFAAAFITINAAVNGDWSMPSQTWDAVLHANSVRLIEDTGNANPWNLRYAPFANYVTPSFYPATFYQIAAAIVTFTGASTLASLNIAAFLLAGWIFPLGMAFFVSCIAPHRWSWQPLALLLGTSLWSFPWAPLGWGVLWPSATSIAMIPFALGALLKVFESPRAGSRGHRILWTLLVLVGAIVVSVSHPRGAVQCAIAVATFVIFYCLIIIFRPKRSGFPRFYLKKVFALLCIAVIVFVLNSAYSQLTSEAFANKVGSILWPIRATSQQEIWNYLVQGPDNTRPAIALGVLIIIGILRSFFKPKYLWLSAAYVAFAWLDITAATVHDVESLRLTSLWYNDRYRITGATALFAIPLMCLGLEYISTLISRLTDRRLSLATLRGFQAPKALVSEERSARRFPVITRQSQVLSVMVVLTAAATGGLNITGHVAYLSQYYRDVQDVAPESLVSGEEQQFMESLPRWVKPDEVVINMPGDGSSMLYAISGLQPMFPITNTLTGAPDLIQIAQNLTVPGKVEGLCPILEKYNSPWVISSTDVFHTQSVSPVDIQTLRVAPGDANFTAVAQGGDMTLYRVSKCFPWK